MCFSGEIAPVTHLFDQFIGGLSTLFITMVTYWPNLVEDHVFLVILRGGFCSRRSRFAVWLLIFWVVSSL